MSIAENLEQVRAEIAAACARANRNPADVKLMAVSKTWGPDVVAEAFRAGQRLFGENRLQEWEHKQQQLHTILGEDVGQLEMHLIGNLQSNKTSKAAWVFSAVDSVDSVKVARRLNDVCEQVGKVLPILVEVKLSEEETKHGIGEYALPGLLRNILEEMNGLEVRGLMIVPPYTDDPEGARPYFRRLRELRDEAVATIEGISLPELSMGMSHDFAVAIEEGSTCVRVGSAIFGTRTKYHEEDEEES
ncbi:YggS family pyridoxal phosphate-dependent enzyme [Terriglobus sp. RCC_193]|uniref:YggS family pyridoxal phosphate-dependent enzyme n=1 Tax=Terriglobus sp. RCC_193 TaxID=3239218 RepID=UPI00352538C4